MIADEHYVRELIENKHRAGRAVHHVSVHISREAAKSYAATVTKQSAKVYRRRVKADYVGVDVWVVVVRDKAAAV